MPDINVSVVVPIFNAASNGRLNRMLNSLKAQSIQNVEFILVFDCPTDNSYDVAKQIAKGDSRFVFIYNKSNLHIGYSRNKGIDASRGEFIAFADDDDVIEPEMYQNLYNIAKEENADIVVSPAVFNNKGKESIEVFDYNSSNLQLYFINRLLGEISEDERNSDPYPYLWGNGNMWNKIFKRTLIINSKAHFIDTRFCCYEDVLFQLKLFCETDKISCDKTPYYKHIYYEEKTNTSAKEDYSNKINKFAFLSMLVDLYYLYPLLISKRRVEKKILNILIDIIPLQEIYNSFFSTKETIQLFKRYELGHFISWFPGFLHKENWRVKRFYLLYVLLIKLL